MLRRFFLIRAVQKVIRDPTQLSGRGFSRIFYMKLFFVTILYIFDTHVVSKLPDVDPNNIEISKIQTSSILKKLFYSEEA